jgi:hypothetical protein
MDRKNTLLLVELLAAFGMVGSIRCQLAGQAVVHELRPPPPPAPVARTAADVEQDVKDIFGVAEPQPATSGLLS